MDDVLGEEDTVVTVLTDTAQLEVHARPDDDALWIAAPDLLALTSFELKPEGACRGEVCVPMLDALRDGNDLDVAGFWRHIGHPVLRSGSGQVWHLAEAAVARRDALESLQAPDFTLPDLAGVEHSLSDFRGKKVFLATWASW